MRHEARIGNAFESNGIRRVLLVDDAYDPPEMDNRALGALAEFLDGASNRGLLVEKGVTAEAVEAARRAADAGRGDSDSVGEVYAALYAAFADGERECDLGGYFQKVRGPALDALRPLQVLLGKCGQELDIVTVGVENGFERYMEKRPQLLFLDYYLSEDVSPSGEVEEDALSGARGTALRFLGEVARETEVHEYPAMVLMSSRSIDDADEFREEASGGRFMRMRFRRLKKDGVRIDGESIVLDHAAADALLDISQGYALGRLFQESVGVWREGVNKALESFERDVARWDRKEVAYLVRFRLREEGQPVSEYLEWLFGEYFASLVEGRVNWKHKAFGELDSDGKLGEDIEAAYDGPSSAVARCFHEVRVRTKRVGPPGRYRLGDLYRVKGEGCIRAVVKPDCDLVVRKGKTKAKSVLTMRGMLSDFEEEEVAADNFMLIDDRPYSVLWKPKELETFTLDGEESLGEGDRFEFVGTLRPLYAQAMQRLALADLGRVGLPVAPALGIRGDVSVWVRVKGKGKRSASDFRKLDVGQATGAVMIPRREGERAGDRVLLPRTLVWRLIGQLKELWDRREEELTGADAKALERVLGREEEFSERILKFGGTTGAVDKRCGASFAIGDGPRRKKDGAWLQVVLRVRTDELYES